VSAGSTSPRDATVLDEPPLRATKELSWRDGEHIQLPTQRIVWGAGRARALAGELRALGARRAVVLTTASLSGNLAEDVGIGLGDALVGVHADLPPHVPRSAVDSAAELALAVDADALVAVGGGSVLDAAKAVSAELRDRGAPPHAHIAVPTTLSGAEFAHYYGVTEPTTPLPTKVGNADPSVVARLVVLDPDATARTPAWLWHGSGVKAIDHAIEGLLSPGERPLGDALAVLGIRGLATHLAARTSDPGVRLACQIAAWQCYSAPADVRLGLSHRIGHVLGGSYGVPHALTSAITLPRVVAALGDEPPSKLALVADALEPRRPLVLDRPTGPPAAAAERLVSLFDGLDLPQCLSDVGITASDVPDIAERVVQASPESVAGLGPDGLERLLREAL
jgi:maleylacetate reductase